MSVINVEQFLKCTVDWANQRNDRFKYYWPVKGGWEGWIQVDLTAYLLEIDSSLEVLREQPVYKNNRQRVDLLLNADQDPSIQIPVEIKAESFFNRTDPFVNGTRDDYLKLDRNRKYEFEDCSCVVMAFPFNQQSLEGVMAITDAEDERIFGRIFTGEVAICIAIYSEGGGWIPQN